jgi:hypothetical protein
MPRATHSMFISLETRHLPFGARLEPAFILFFIFFGLEYSFYKGKLKKVVPQTRVEIPVSAEFPRDG